MISKATIIDEKNLGKVKALLAQDLYSRNYKQTEISTILNITQPMVSNYLKMNFSSSDKKIIQNIIDNHEDLSSIQFSILLTNNNTKENETYFLSTKEHILSNEKSTIIKNLYGALDLLKNKDLKNIIPKVKMNCAMAKISATTKSDIGSIPGGIITVKGKIKSHSDPEFGASSHLAEILLTVRKKNPSIKSIMNIAYSKKIKQKIIENDYTIELLQTNYKMNKINTNDFLIHEGSFGIEPSTYILGINAVDVVKKCLTLI